MVRRLIHLSMMLAIGLMINSLSSTVSQAGGNGCGFTMTGANQILQFKSAVGSSDTKYVTVWNTSDGAITLKLTTNGSSVFMLDPAQMTLEKGDSMYFKIAFVPNANVPPGSVKTGTLTVTNSAANCNMTVALSGTTNDDPTTGGDSLKLSTTSINFGSLPADSTACKNVTLVNKSENPVTVLGWGIDANCDDRVSFDITSSFGQTVTLKKGEFATFKVCYHATTAVPKVSCALMVQVTKDNNITQSTLKVSLNGAVNGNNGGGGGTVTDSLKATPSVLDFGAMVADSEYCKTVSLTNTGTTTIPITSWKACDNTALKVSSSFGASGSLAPGETVTFTVCYKADAAHSSLGCKLLINHSNGKVVYVTMIGSLKGGSNTNKECLSFELGDAWRDAVVVGASADRTLTVKNPTGMPVTIYYDSLGCQDVSSFKSTATYPITIGAYQKVSIPYTFTPQAAPSGTMKEKYVVCFVFAVSGDSIDCKYVSTNVYGLAPGSSNTVDSVIRPLFPDEKRIIAIKSTPNTAPKTFYFTNNLDVNVTVTNIKLSDGTFFTITSTNPSAVPFVLKPNEGMSVTIAYTATDNQVHSDKLIITADHALTEGSEFTLQGGPLETADVKTSTSAMISISVVPNPATTNLTATISGAEAATVSVYDMLGSLVTSATMTNQWNWNTSSNGQAVSAGSYILRFSGKDINGVPFVISKRVVIN